MKFSGQVLPSAKLVSYEIDIRRVMRAQLALVIADGRMFVDGREIYVANDLRVGLFQSTEDLLTMRRVVVTGMGIVSCLGNDAAERDRIAAQRLRRASASSRTTPSAACAARSPACRRSTWTAQIDRKLKRFMGDAAAYTYIAMRDAIADAGLRTNTCTHPRTGVDRRLRRRLGRTGRSRPATCCAQRACASVGPYMVPRTMCSTVSACAGDAHSAFSGVELFDLRGLRDVGALHRRGRATLIRRGVQDVVFAGGGEEAALGHDRAVRRDGRAVHARFNDTPARRRGRTTPVATASSSPAAAACWCSRITSTPGRAMRASTPSSSATA